MKYLLLSLFVVIFSINVLGQRSDYIPPSPQAFNFMKFGEYPVDLSTGLVDISIPLLSLKLKTYQLPIEAKYHASGRKVDMNFSELGLNWKLEAYGMISREIKGISDLRSYRDVAGMEKDATYFNSLSSDDRNAKQIKYERRLQLAMDHPSNSDYDTEYDIYNISFRGISSSFIIRNSGEILFLKYFPYKVSFQNGVFYVTDSDGVEYVFGSITESSVNYGGTNTFGGTDGTMSWLLAKITTPEKEFIRFKYGAVSSSQPNLSGNLSYGSKATLGDYFYNYPEGTTDGAPTSSLVLKTTNTISNENYTLQYLLLIESSIGNVEFEYNTNNYTLNKIIHKSVSNTLISKIDFLYQDLLGKSFSIPNNQGIAIKDVVFNGSETNGSNQKYSFEYYQGSAHGTSLIDYCYGKDYWGYANENSNSNLIPIDKINNYQYPYNLANPVTIGTITSRNSSYTQKLIGTLRKVTYPTFGSTEFIYEDNRYNYLGQIKSGPGIRIKTVKNFDGAHEYFKEYEYGSNGVGELSWQPQINDFQTSTLITSIPLNGTLVDSYQSVHIQKASRYRYREFFSEPIGFIKAAYRQPVYYSEVTEYLKDASGMTLGKTIYDYSLPVFDKKSETFSDNHTRENTYYDSFIPHLYSTALLTNKSIFEKINNTYKLKNRISYAYKKYKEVIIPQMAYYRRHSVLSSSYTNPFNVDEQRIEVEKPSSTSDPDWALPWSTIRTIDYNLISATVNLDSKVEMDSTSSLKIEKSTQYLYESTYSMEPSTVITTNSDGVELKTKSYYPDDITSINLSGGNLLNDEFTAIQSLKKGSQHEINSPIQVEMYKNGVLSKIERNIFKLFSGKSKFNKKYTKNLTSNLNKDLEISVYDTYGNPLEIKNQEEPTTTYLWGYAGQYPIAEIKNVTYAEALAVLGQATIDNLNLLTVSETAINTAMTTLRSGLPKAMITSYTYIPLVGMKSKTDPRGVTEYYEYDGMQRLVAIKDQKGDVIKTFCYNYKGQLYDCFGNSNLPAGASIVNLAYFPSVLSSGQTMCSSTNRAPYYLLNPGNIVDPPIIVGTVLYQMDGSYVPSGYYTRGSGIARVAANGVVAEIIDCNTAWIEL
ncbi:hypothetical protein LZQ00_04665 [Sphingobacterium sp. SRCM116780]|uniref:hypothetical protein n=1 Tax=Sphingobacterium sp. SRCM116780 TaxID=2907623 RepID=UPI001F479A17|nr:hypothetical protein [Sphingobacterium sp. SRCM116780]UIR57108.1 hypothetical protein LZQ00_04665 [Sphingobacterium sp. SRCM116780]